MKIFSDTNNYKANNIQSTKNHYQLQFCLTKILDRANLKNGAIYFYKTNQIDAPKKPLELSFNFGKVPAEQCTSYPILYQRKKIGDLLLDKDQESQEQIYNLSEITKSMALLFKRFKTNECADQAGSEYPVLVGFSEQSLALESFIEKSSDSISPVIIEGDHGNEMSAIARAIHDNSHLIKKKYREIDCSTSSNIDERIKQAWKESIGGSLYLHEINELSLELQCHLIQLLHGDVKIIASSTRPLEQLVHEGKFYRQLYTALNFLKIHIPPLRERKEDIPYMLNQLILKYRCYDNQTLTEETKQALYNFDWPENYMQLERVMAKLLALSNSNPIELHELKLVLPTICSNIKNNENLYPIPTKIDLLGCLTNKDYRELSGLQIALRRSLQYLAENYSESITLDKLSMKAHVSSSHLSFLFKYHLNKSFKKVLAELRIEQAKRLFENYPYKRVTDICLEVVFGDLSHFEKIFKRYTKMTPRSYKDSFHRKCFY